MIPLRIRFRMFGALLLLACRPSHDGGTHPAPDSAQAVVLQRLDSSITAGLASLADPGQLLGSWRLELFSLEGQLVGTATLAFTSVTEDGPHPASDYRRARGAFTLESASGLPESDSLARFLPARDTAAVGWINDSSRIGISLGRISSVGIVLDGKIIGDSAQGEWERGDDWYLRAGSNHGLFAMTRKPRELLAPPKE